MATPLTIDAQLRLVGVQRTISDAVARINPVINFRLNQESLKRFQEPLGKITGQVSQFEKSFEAANARVIAFGAAVGVLSAAYRGFTQLVKITIDVEKRLQDINVVLNTNNQGLEKFSQQLFKIARDTGQTFNVAANAATELARQGLSAEQTLKRVNDALVLTRLSGLDVVNSVEALTATVNGFARAGLDTSTIINKLANVDAAFAVSSRDLAEALSRVGSSAQDAGVSFDELLAIVTSVQQTTARGGAVIGNAFKTIFTRIGRSDTLKQLEDLGVKIRDVSGAALPAITILQNLAKTYDEVGESQKNAIAEQVGGVYQINILRSALSDLSKQYSIYSRALNTSLGSTDQAYRRNIELNKTLSALVNQTAQSIIEFANEIGKVSIAPGLRQLIEYFTDFLNFFNNRDVKPLIEGLAKGLVGVFTGPGIVIAIAGFVALTQKAFVFLGQSLKVILSQGQGLQEQKRLQSEIGAILRSNNGEYARQLNNITSIADREKFLINLIRERARLSNLTNIEGSTYAASLSKKIRIDDNNKVRRAGIGGFFNPNFADNKNIPNYSIPNFATYYHGTSKDKLFENSKRGFNVGSRGAFFTSDLKGAQSYAFYNDSMDGWGNKNTNYRVIETDIDVKNPYVLQGDELSQYKNAKSYRSFQKQLAAKARYLGHDAIDYGDGVISYLGPSSNIKIVKSIFPVMSGGKRAFPNMVAKIPNFAPIFGYHKTNKIFDKLDVSKIGTKNSSEGGRVLGDALYFSYGKNDYPHIKGDTLIKAVIDDIYDARKLGQFEGPNLRARKEFVKLFKGLHGPLGGSRHDYALEKFRNFKRGRFYNIGADPNIGIKALLKGGYGGMAAEDQIIGFDNKKIFEIGRDKIPSMANIPNFANDKNIRLFRGLTLHSPVLAKSLLKAKNNTSILANQEIHNFNDFIRYIRQSRSETRDGIMPFTSDLGVAKLFARVPFGRKKGFKKVGLDDMITPSSRFEDASVIASAVISKTLPKRNIFTEPAALKKVFRKFGGLEGLLNLQKRIGNIGISNDLLSKYYKRRSLRKPNDYSDLYAYEGLKSFDIEKEISLLDEIIGPANIYHRKKINKFPNLAKVPNFLPTSFLKPFRDTLKGIKSGPLYFDANIRNSPVVGGGTKGFDTAGYYDRIRDAIVLGPAGIDTQTLTHESVHRLIQYASRNINGLRTQIGNRGDDSLRQYIKGKYYTDDLMEEGLANYGYLPLQGMLDVAGKLQRNPDKLARLYGRLQTASYARLVKANLQSIPAAMRTNLFSPNFANPLASAISRELSAGVKPNQVRIERSPQLVAPHNPLGMAITNTRDEPNGINQGIARARAEGRNPKTYNIPGFADRDPKTGRFITAAQARARLRGRDESGRFNPASVRNEIILRADQTVNAFMGRLEQLTAKLLAARPTQGPERLSKFVAGLNPNQILYRNPQAMTREELLLGNDLNPYSKSAPDSPQNLRILLRKKLAEQVLSPTDILIDPRRTNKANETVINNAVEDDLGQTARRNRSRRSLALQRLGIVNPRSFDVETIPADRRQDFLRLIKEEESNIDRQVKKRLQKRYQFIQSELDKGVRTSVLSARIRSLDIISSFRGRDINELNNRERLLLRGSAARAVRQESFGGASLGDIKRNEFLFKRYQKLVEERVASLQSVSRDFGSDFEKFRASQGIFGRFGNAEKLENRFIEGLSKTNPNIDRGLIADELREKRLERQNRFQNRLLGISLGGGFLSGIGAQSENDVIRTSSNVLSGAATGASFGLIGGGPLLAAAGAAAIGLGSLITSINDVTGEFNRLQKSIQNNIDENTRLINSTQNYAQIQQQIVEAIRSGVDQKSVNNLVKQAQDSLRQINDASVKREIISSGNDPSRLQRIISDLSLQFNRQQIANDAATASFGVRQIQGPLANFRGAQKDIPGEILRGAAASLARASNFRNSEDIDAFINEANKNPRQAFAVFRDKFIKELDFGKFVENFGKNTSALKATFALFGEIAKENLDIVDNTNIRKLSEASLYFKKIIEDLNRQILLESKLNELRVGSISRILDAFDNARAGVGIQTSIQRIDETTRNRRLIGQLNTNQQINSAISIGVSSILKQAEENGITSRNKQFIDTLKNILVGRTEFNLDLLLKAFPELGNDLTGELKQINDNLIQIKEQSRLTNQELNIIAALDKIMVANEQRNKILGAGFDPERNSQIRRNIEFGKVVRLSRGKQLQNTEEILGLLDQIGAPEDEQSLRNRRGLRREAAFENISDLLTKLGGFRVGSTPEQLRQGVDQIGGNTIIGRRISGAIDLLERDPESELRKFEQDIINRRGGVSLSEIAGKQGISVADGTLITIGKNTNTILEEKLGRANTQLDDLITRLEKAGIVKSQIEKENEDRINMANNSIINQADNKSRASSSRLSGLTQDEITKGLKIDFASQEGIGRSLKTFESAFGRTNITNPLKILNISSDLQRQLINDPNFGGDNGKTIESLVDNNLKKLVEIGIVSGPNAAKDARKKIEEFVALNIDQIIEQAKRQRVAGLDLRIEEGTIKSLRKSGLKAFDKEIARIESIMEEKRRKAVEGIGEGGGETLRERFGLHREGKRTFVPLSKQLAEIEKYRALNALKPSAGSQSITNQSEVENTKETSNEVEKLNEEVRRLIEYRNQLDTGEGFLAGFKQGIIDLGDEFITLEEIGQRISRNIGESFTQSFGDVITGSKRAGNAFRGFVVGVLNDTARMFAQKGMQGLLDAIGPSINDGLSKIFKFNKGGKVPTLLTGGEYVFNKNLASKIGYNTLSNINRKASGGLVVGGSGVRDDVFAMLNSGDFVLNKKATKSLGIQTMATGGTINPFESSGNGPDPSAFLRIFGSQTKIGNTGILGGLKGSFGQVGIGLAISLLSSLFKEKERGPYYNLVLKQRQLEKDQRKYGDKGTLIYTPDGQLSRFAPLVAPKSFNMGGKVPAMLTGGETVIPNYIAKNIGYSNLKKYNSGGIVGSSSITNTNNTSNGTAPTININISIDKSGATTETTSGQSEGDNLNKLGQRIKAVVREEIANQQRNGGLLSKTGRA